MQTSLSTEKAPSPRIPAAPKRTGLASGFGSFASGVTGGMLSAGRPLDDTTRGFMENRFGHDFSRVRVHNDPQAARSAGLVAAKAYTFGQDIVFAAGQYNPATDEGRRLLAHELTHVIQQGGVVPLMRHAAGMTPAVQQGAQAPGAGSVSLGPVADSYEAEAGSAAERLSASTPVPVTGQAAPRIQRAPGWNSDTLEIRFEPQDPLTPGQESYTENGYLSQRMSKVMPVYKGPFCQESKLPFKCGLEFRVDYSDEKRPQPFTSPQVSADFEFSVPQGGSRVQVFGKSFSDKNAGYGGQDMPLKTNFGTRFNFNLEENGDFRMVFKLFDPDTGITRLYDDTIKVEAKRPCM